MRRTLYSARLRFQLFVLGQLAAALGVVFCIVQQTLVGAAVCAAALAVFTNGVMRIRCSRCHRRLLFYEGRWRARLPSHCQACGRSTRRSSAGLPERSAAVQAYDLGRRRNYEKG